MQLVCITFNIFCSDLDFVCDLVRTRIIELISVVAYVLRAAILSRWSSHQQVRIRG